MSKFAQIRDRNDGSKSYKIITSLTVDELDVTILDGENSYVSKIKIEDVEEFANSFETTVDCYLKMLHQLLSEKSTATISVIGDEWTVYKNENIKYFVKKIEKCNYSTKLETILIDIFKEKSNLELKVNKLKEEKREIINECTSLKALLEEKVNEHSNHEKKLLSSFVLLLNEKKRRIQYLTEALESQIIDTVSSKRVKLDQSDEELSLTEISDAENSNTNNISNDDNDEAILPTDKENDDNSKLLIDDNTKLSNYDENDDDEDSLLRSPEDSSSRGGGGEGMSLPKRVSTGSTVGVSFREGAKEVVMTQEVESQVESVVSSEAQFTSQDIYDRLFN